MLKGMDKEKKKISKVIQIPIIRHFYITCIWKRVRSSIVLQDKVLYWNTEWYIEQLILLNKSRWRDQSSEISALAAPFTEETPLCRAGEVAAPTLPSPWKEALDEQVQLIRRKEWHDQAQRDMHNWKPVWEAFWFLCTKIKPHGLPYNQTRFNYRVKLGDAIGCGSLHDPRY